MTFDGEATATLVVECPVGSGTTYTLTVTRNEWRDALVQTILAKESNIVKGDFDILSVNDIPWAELGVMSWD